MIPYIKEGSLAADILDRFLWFWDEYKIKTPRGFGSVTLSTEYLEELAHDSKRWKLKRELQRLQERKLIEIKTEGHKIMASLSKEGQILVLKKKIKSCDLPLPENYWCFIIFDIPESVRHIRTEIRSLIKQMDGEYVQMSVWKTKFAVAKEFNELIQLIKADKWVKIIEGKMF